MTLVELVKLDERAVSFLGDYETLVRGSTALELVPVAGVEPVVITHDNGLVDLSRQAQELADNIHTAASQIKRYYDRLAESDEAFVPFWTQETTFQQAIEKLPSVERRRFLESYGSFLSRNDFEGRVSLDKRLEYFRPFYELNGAKCLYAKVPTTERDAWDVIRKAQGASEVDVLVCMVTPFFLLTGMMSFIGAAAEIPVALPIITGVLSYGGALGLPIFAATYDRSAYKARFEGVIDVPMERKAKYADNLITTVHKYAV